MRSTDKTLLGLAVVSFWVLASAPTWAVPIQVDIISETAGGAVSVWTVSGPTDLHDAWFLLDDSSYSRIFDVGAGEYAFQIWGAAFGHGNLARSFPIGDGSPALGSIDVLGLQLFANGSTPATPIISIAEPVSAALVLLGLLGVLVMRRHPARAIHPIARRAASA